MTSSNGSRSSSTGGVPPGFRFHPTDEELLHFYLKKKITFQKFDMEVIREIDLNKIEPWDLQERCRIGSTPQNEWYFFSHKDRKYPTGSRTNRATNAGFWKATGRDKCIRNTFKKIGMRKTLVFYRGRAPHGQKTDWIMHEYRLEDGDDANDNQLEDGWVVCRVFKKKNLFKVSGTEGNSTSSSSDHHLITNMNGSMINSNQSRSALMMHNNNRFIDASTIHHTNHHSYLLLRDHEPNSTSPVQDSTSFSLYMKPAELALQTYSHSAAAMPPLPLLAPPPPPPPRDHQYPDLQDCQQQQQLPTSSHHVMLKQLMTNDHGGDEHHHHHHHQSLNEWAMLDRFMPPSTGLTNSQSTQNNGSSGMDDHHENDHIETGGDVNNMHETPGGQSLSLRNEMDLWGYSK